MAEAFITRRGGSGSSGDFVINGLLETYKIQAGQEISAGDFVKFIEGNVSGDGARFMFNDHATNLQAVAISENEVLVLWHNDNTMSAYYTYDMTVLVTFGESVTQGTPLVFNSGTSKFSATLWNSNIFDTNYSEVLIVYNPSVTDYIANTLIIYNGVVSLGTETTLIESQPITDMSITRITNESAVVGYRSVANSWYATAVVITRNPDMGQPVCNTPVVVNSEASTDIKVNALSANRVLISYYGGSSWINWLNVLTVVGGTITSVGTPWLLDSNSAIATAIGILNSSTAIVAFKSSYSTGYPDYLTQDALMAKVFSISGSDITMSEPYLIADLTSYEITVIATINALTESKAIILYSTTMDRKLVYKILTTTEENTMSVGLAVDVIDIIPDVSSSLVENYIASTISTDKSKIIVIFQDDHRDMSDGMGTILNLIKELALSQDSNEINGVAHDSGVGGETIYIYTK